MRTHTKRLGMTFMLAIIVTALFGASSAYAVGSGSLSKTLNIVDNERIRVYWNGFPQPTAPDAVISVCNGNALLPTFDVGSDCGPGTIKSASFTVAGSGRTGTTCTTPPNGPNDNIPCNTGLNRDYPVNVNEDFTGLGWECGPASVAPLDPADTKYSTCYIRVTEGIQSNTDADFFMPITWDEQPEPVVPEAPFAVLLPAGAVAVAAAAYFVLRNRRPTVAA